MKTISNFLIITGAIVIPWSIIRVAGWESYIVVLLKPLQLSDTAILALLIVPPLTWFIIKWLIEPKSKIVKRYSGSRNTLIKFRG